ncbi:uncharacterized protein LOC143621409 [Bidens hawaiensis]|uniref:uncharacterized protein LOC143621409 n=1 Tax=Bidens hawaiensis TaxID=980011 RepID=UPI00404A4067
MLKSFTVLDVSGIVPLNSIKKEISIGNETLFWNHPWYHTLCLADKFPRLYALEMMKNCSVAQRVRGESWEWRRNLRGGAEMAQFLEMQDMINRFSLSNGNDRWVWLLQGISEFSVKGIREIIDNSMLLIASRKTIWFPCLPLKINICGWRVVGNRFPTRTNLATKGIDVPSTICPLCNGGLEFVIHVFGECA